MLNGRVDKLNIMETLLRKNEDNSRRFTNSLYTCNIEERIKMLNETGHHSLALLTAKVHEKNELEAEILENAKNSGKEIRLNEEEVIINDKFCLIFL